VSARAETAGVHVPGWLLDTASPRALQLAALLRRLADGTGEVEVSRLDLAGAARCSRRIVDTALAELEADGFLAIVPRPLDPHRGRVPNLYRLLKPGGTP